jgi:hypothetical protein
MKNSAIDRLKRKKGDQTRFIDGQRSQTLSMNWQDNRSADSQPKDRPMERKKVVLKEIR